MDKKSCLKYFVFLPIVLIVTVLLWAVPPEFFHIDGLTVTQQRTIAIFAFAALMWILEVVPNWVTSLIVIVASLLTISNKSFSFLSTPSPYFSEKEIAVLDDTRDACLHYNVYNSVVVAIDSAKMIVADRQLGEVGKGNSLTKEEYAALKNQYKAIITARNGESILVDGYANLIREKASDGVVMPVDSTAYYAAAAEFAWLQTQPGYEDQTIIHAAETHKKMEEKLSAAASTIFNKNTNSSVSISKEITFEQGKFVPFKTLMGAFADPVVMLFLGGFVLAIVASKYGMDVKLARALLKPFGKKPRMVLLGFLTIISIFSMFMSNTATAAMFLTFLAPVLATLPDQEKGKIGLALAIPIAANVGGIGTPIGTPPNATAVGVLENNDMVIGFAEWSVRMIPFVVIMILIAWVVLMLAFPFKTKEIVIEIPKKKRETTWRDHVAWITFAVTILLWMTETWTGVNSNIVALIPLAVYTATGVFTSEDIKEINWSVLWLVAGGFALGYALNDTGLAKAIISSIDFSVMSVVTVFVVAGFICYFLSNFISNSATAALLIPIMVAMGKGLMESANSTAFAAFGGQKALAVFVAMCASLAMLLPISTPPNALASSTGLVQTKDMAKIGLIIGVIGLVLAFFWVTKIVPFPL